MPVIGQPAHTHFTPVVSPVVLDRISLSITYVYNISAASYRVSLARTYVYDLRVIVSRSQIYVYHVNPVLPTGPTRLYFHAVLNPLPNLPTTERSTLTSNKVVDAETVNRTMDTLIGVAQTFLSLGSIGTTALQRYYFTRYVTDTLQGISSITAQTWTYNFATTSNNTTGGFPVAGTNQPVRVTAYVWRPAVGGGSKVGDIVDGNSGSTVDVTTSERAHITTFSGNQVLGVQDGDVLVFEVWFEVTQSTTSGGTDRFYYDGTTVTIVKNTVVSNHASFIQTPQGLAFGAPLVRVAKTCIQKYNIIGRVTGFSQVYKYIITALASLSRTYQYNIASAVSLSRSYNYNLIGRLSLPSISKYNILVRMAAPKIFRYALQSTLQTSRIYKYNIFNSIPAPLSSIYKYNITNRIQLTQTNRYSIFSRTTISRIYKYSVIGRISLSSIYKYNIIKIVLASSVYKYNILNRMTSTFTQTYIYNLTILSHVSLSSVYKYNLVSRLSFSQIYQYHILQRVTKKAIVFDGVDDAIALGNNTALNNLENFTITCWIYPTANSSGSTPHIFVKRYPSANGFLLYFSTNNFTLNWRTVNASAVNVVSSSNFIDLNGANKWYHVAVTFNRATGSQQLLINAVIRDSDTNTGLAANQIGSTDNMSINGGSVHWAGRIRDFRLFRSELSQAEINKIYTDDPTASTPNYWLKTEEGTGNPKDSISGTFTGTLQNGASWLTYESGKVYRYLYSLTKGIFSSKTYRYSTVSRVPLSRIYRYNLLVPVLLSKNYIYNLLGTALKSQQYIYDLRQKLSVARIFRYRIGEGVISLHNYLYNLKARVRLSSTYVYNLAALPSGILWQLTGKNTDFPDSLENLVKDYIKENWSITDPVLGQTPIITSVISRQHQSQVDNFAYDNYRSYYIRIKEVGSEVKNRQVRLNTYEFSTPVEIECFSRRLRKGESYPQLNAMMNELQRIFGTYQPDQIFGVQGISLDRISSMEKERPPAKNIWARRLRIILHYYKVSVAG